MQIRTALVLLLLSCHLAVVAQYTPIEQIYDVEWVNLQHKTPPGFYYDIVRDNEGYYWIASSSGLHVYDGTKTITYSSSTTEFCMDPSIEDWETKTLIVTSTGMLYAGMWGDGSYLQIDPKTRRLIGKVALKEGVKPSQKLSELPTGEVIALSVDSAAQYNVLIINPKDTQEAIYIQSSDMYADQSRIKDVESNADQIFILSDTAIISIDKHGNQLNTYPSADTPPFYNLLSDGKDVYASDRYFKYIHKLKEDNTIVRIERPSQIPSNMSSCYMHEDILIISNHEHLYLVDRKAKHLQDLSSAYVTTKKQYTPTTLTDDIQAVLKEPGKNSYLILTSSNLYRLKPKSASVDSFRIPVAASMPLPSMRQTIKTSGGSVVSSYYNGLASYDDSQGQLTLLPLQYSTDQKMEVAYSLSEHNGTLYWNNAQVKQDGQVTNLTPHLPYMHTLNFMHGDSVVLIPWETRELYLYNTLTNILSTKQLDQELYKEKGSSLYQTNMVKPHSDGLTYWISTAYNGIARVALDGTCVQRYKQELLLPDRKYGIYDIEIVPSGIWYASGYGLYKLDTTTLTVEHFSFPYINNYGLQSPRIIYTIEPIDKYTYYLGSSKGLLLFDTRTNSYSVLPDDHPMASIEYNRNASTKIDGRYYLGTTTGLYAFREDQLTWKNSNQLTGNIKPIRIQAYHRDTIINPNRLSDQNKYTLPPGSKNIEVEFSIPAINSSTYYSYRIQNLDSTWSTYTTDSEFRIYSLPPGDHILEVRASADQQQTNVKYSRIHITMSEVWYKKWWAYLLYLLAALLGFYGFYKYRVDQLRKYERLRTKISSDLHDDVGTLLTSVAMQSEILGLDAPPDKISRFEKLSALSREAMGRMRDTVWAIDSRKDNVESLIDRMNDFLSDINIDQRFQITFNYPQTRSTKLPPDIRQNLFLIFKETVANAFKYSNGDQLQIDLKKSTNKISLAVRDNGVVSTETIKTSGTGLSNMKMRAKSIGGQFTMSTKDGFSIVVDAPLK